MASALRLAFTGVWERSFTRDVSRVKASERLRSEANEFVIFYNASFGHTKVSGFTWIKVLVNSFNLDF
jgi:hypothetical protein